MARTPTILATLSLVLLALGGGTAMAGDIVTVPTANQLRAGEVDLAAYYIDVDQGSLIAPLQPLGIDWIRAQTLYAGVTDKLEIDAHRYDVDSMPEQTIWQASFLVLEEDEGRPNVVVGARDLSDVSGNTSYFVCAAKTLNPPVGGPPTEPIYRLHLSLGTEDNTLFGEERHDGLFGGIQILLKPSNPAVGLVALYDATDVITGLTVVPEPGWPTIKGGTFGGHWWLGISHTWNVK
jgi:hypothetical protein